MFNYIVENATGEVPVVEYIECVQTDTHVIVAAGKDRIIVAFRGTKSVTNLLTDVSMWTSDVGQVFTRKKWYVDGDRDDGDEGEGIEEEEEKDDDALTRVQMCEGVNEQAEVDCHMGIGIVPPQTMASSNTGAMVECVASRNGESSKMVTQTTRHYIPGESSDERIEGHGVGEDISEGNEVTGLGNSVRESKRKMRPRTMYAAVFSGIGIGGFDDDDDDDGGGVEEHLVYTATRTRIRSGPDSRASGKKKMMRNGNEEEGPRGGESSRASDGHVSWSAHHHDREKMGERGESRTAFHDNSEEDGGFFEMQGSHAMLLEEEEEAEDLSSERRSVHKGRQPILWSLIPAAKSFSLFPFLFLLFFPFPFSK